MKSTMLKLLASLFALSLIAAACGDDDVAEDTSADSGDADALAAAEDLSLIHI